MEFSRRLIIACVACAVWLSGCAVSKPRPSESQQPVAVAVIGNKKIKPDVSPSAKRDYDRALASIRAKRYEQAERILVRMTQTYPTLSGPYVNLGMIYHRMGRSDQAMETLNKAIEINPNRPDTYNQLGIVLRSAGQFKAAHDAYERALHFDPNYVYAHLNLGILYDLYLRDASKALDHYERYQSLLPKQDQQVSKWVIDLERRTQKRKKTKTAKKR
ncbi:MAG: tetratricopeptide repeat protein [Gammaproteobacteria bacterium]|nr:tetratricopeptide repeat protein [Gammaproteobacteria bacterium]